MIFPGAFQNRTRLVGGVGLCGLAVLFAALGYWQVFRTDLASEDHNPRLLSRFADPSRGRILDREGNVLAESLPDGARHYRDASVAHAVGYIDPRYGSQGAELAFNAQLTGQASQSWLGAVRAEFLRTRAKGQDVKLTIDPAIQAAAAKALGARKGAVIALDPRTGEVLAMVSVPTYDPGGLAANGEALLKDPDSPLLNRATQGLYPPGSTFKTVTASAALTSGVLTPETIVTCPGEIVIDGFPIQCTNTAQGVGTYPFKNAFAFSVNAIFAQLGVQLGWARLSDMAKKFGFESSLPFTLDTAKSSLTRPGTERTKVLLASTAFGQGELLATPLQMAAITATIANEGVFMRPHLGLATVAGNHRSRSLEGPSGTVVLNPDVAKTMRELMTAVIDNNQASGVAIPGVRVAGKTGTAETAVPGVSHAWFIGFAPAANPVIAVAVIVEGGGRGGEVAAPIAGAVMRAAVAR